jgi:uncharacterized protein YraI
MTGRPNPTSARDRANGQFLTNSWNGAAASGAGAILIVSWNEYFENSHIEPSQNFGTQSLDVLRPLIANWKAGGPVSIQAPASGGGAAPAVPSGPDATVLRPNVFSLNVRSAPVDGAVIGQIGVDDIFAVAGEANGWYKINFNGQEGWVSGQFVGVSQQQAPAAAGGVAPGAPSGVTYTTNYRVSLRSGPGASFDRIDTLPYPATVEVVGRTADSQWVQVNYNGQSGWVAANLGNLSANLQAVTVTG